MVEFKKIWHSIVKYQSLLNFNIKTTRLMMKILILDSILCK